jgi:hypothetical protein
MQNFIAPMPVMSLDLTINKILMRIQGQNDLSYESKYFIGTF